MYFLPGVVAVGFINCLSDVPNKWETTGFAAFSFAFFWLVPSPAGKAEQPITVNLQIKDLIEPTPVGLSVSSHLSKR